MRSKILSGPSLYTCCAAILLLFAIGHTAGFLLFSPSQADGKMVLGLMHSVQFVEDGQSFTYYGFYQGFGLLITACQLFMAAVALSFAGMLRSGAGGPEGLAWLFAVLQLTTFFLSYLYFPLPPIVLSAALTVLSAVAALQSRRAGLWQRRATGGFPVDAVPTQR